ncbi:MAG: hypothetical protein MPJ78_17915 [Hyphomicrobiaceae bacterium]|nr:hypothetical protein [Hyphomicrobiaceae bacterium]
MSELGSWRELRDALEARRKEINEEISAYPPPITGCDSQFNHLLEARQQLNRELGRLQDEMAGSADPQAIAAFIESCPFFAGDEGEKHA